MNIMSDAMAGADSPLKKLELALQQAAAGGRNKKDADFKQAYPVLEQHLACNVTQKELLEYFNAAYGHKLHPPQFRKMLEMERKRRSESGEEAICHSCGQKLNAVDQDRDDDSNRTD